MIEWYVAAMIVGVIAPWVVMGRTIRLAFAERGVIVGLGTWFGIAVVTVPIMVLFWWAARLLF